MDLSEFTLAGGVVNAAAYPRDGRTPAAPAPVPPEVMANIRRARVELYCSRDVQAVADIRAAREQLRRCGAPLHVVPLQALDAACWLAMHGHTMEAEEALDAALTRLEAVRTSA